MIAVKRYEEVEHLTYNHDHTPIDMRVFADDYESDTTPLEGVCKNERSYRDVESVKRERTREMVAEHMNDLRYEVYEAIRCNVYEEIRRSVYKAIKKGEC